MRKLSQVLSVVALLSAACAPGDSEGIPYDDVIEAARLARMSQEIKADVCDSPEFSERQLLLAGERYNFLVVAFRMHAAPHPQRVRDEIEAIGQDMERRDAEVRAQLARCR